MQLRSKLLFGLVIGMLVLSTAPTAEAQINITLFGNGSTNEINTNRTANTGDFNSIGAGLLVSGALLATSTLTTTVLTLTYPGSLTSAPAAIPASFGTTAAVPTQDPMQIVGATGVFALASIRTVINNTGVIQIGLPGFPDLPAAASAGNTLSGSFRIVGARIDTTGLTAPATVSASLSSSSNNYILSTSSVTVISATADGIGSLAVGARTDVVSNGTATIFSNTIVGDGTASILLTEGFASAWRSATQYSTNGTSALSNGTQILLTFAGVPAGVTVPIAVTSSSSTLGTPALSVATITSKALTSVLSFPAQVSSLTAVETVQINIGTITVGATTTSLTAGDMTVTADLNPQGTALGSNNKASTTGGTGGGYPRFSSSSPWQKCNFLNWDSRVSAKTEQR